MHAVARSAGGGVMSSQNRTWAKVVGMVVAGVLVAVPAAGQTNAPASSGRGVWEVDVHIGDPSTPQPTGGVSALPDPGAPFTTTSGRPSRRVSTWYVGDGALLLNDVLRALGSGAQITSLDTTVKSR